MIFCLMIIMQTAGFPLFFLFNLAAVIYYRQNDLDKYQELRIISFIPVLVSAAAFLCGIGIALYMFRYYYSRTETDKVFALPLNRDQRFLADYFSGLIVYTVPFLAAVILSAVILAGGQMNGKLTERMLLGYVKIECLTKDFIMLAAGILMIMILFYSFCVFSAVCCGRFPETLFFAVLTAAVLPVFVVVTGILILMNAPGVDFYFGNMPYLGAAGPAGAVLRGIELADEMFNGIDVFPEFFRLMISCTAVSLVLTVVSFLLNRKRKAEDAAKPFVFHVFYYIVLFLINFCITGAMSAEELTAAGIFVAFVVLLTIETVKNRGIPCVLKFLRSALVFAAAAGMSFVLIKLSESTEGFGAGRYIPDVKDVSQADVSLYLGEKMEKQTGNWFYDLSFTDNEEIDLAVRTNRMLLNYYTEAGMSDGDDSSSESPGYREAFHILYYLKNGKKVSRYYSVPEDTLQELMPEYLRCLEAMDTYTSKNISELEKVRGNDLS